MTNEFKPLFAKISKPTNKRLGSVLGEKKKPGDKSKAIDESTIRSWKKKDIDYYEKKLLEYRMKKSPFIPSADFEDDGILNPKDFYNMIKEGRLPGVIDKDGGSYVPHNLQDILDTKETLRSLGSSNVISVSNYKGGVGKTTTTVNLAATYSFYGFDVLICDFDGQGNSTAGFEIYRRKKVENVDLSISKLEDIYDLENSDFKYTIVDLISEVENDNIEQIVKDSVINLNDRVKSVGKLDILPNSSDLENAFKYEYIDKTLSTYGNVNQALDEILSFVKDDYDIVLLDTPPSIMLPLRMSVLASDYFVVAFTPDKMSKDGIQPFIKPIDMNNKAYKKLKNKDIVILGGVINLIQNNINIHNVNKKLVSDDLYNIVKNSNLGETFLFDQNIKRDNIITESQNDKNIVLQYEPMHELVRDYFNLADEILERIIIDKMSKQ